MTEKVRKWNIRNRSDLGLEEISKLYNPVIRGWFEYYGKFHPSGLYPFCRSFNKTLIAWAIKKYKRLNRSKRRAGQLLQKIAKERPKLFEHWKRGMIGSFV